MSIKTLIVSRVAARMTSLDTQTRRREEVERKRRAAGEPHIVHYFHQADDPYSRIAAKVLPEFARRYEVTIEPHLVSEAPDWAAPDRDRLIAYSRRDAARLAQSAALPSCDFHAQPSEKRVAIAEAMLAAAVREGVFVQRAAQIGSQLWSEAPLSGPEADAAGLIAEGNKLRDSLGHYLGATFFYGGEWYWGLDRLHYLEARLQEMGLARENSASPIYLQPDVPNSVAPTRAAPAEIDFFLSFRSPYTYIATERVIALSKKYNAKLNLRFVLPMVMRGMQVPPTKGRYITFDTAREARRIGVEFGKIADPVGRPVERGYSLLPWAIGQGRGEAYCLSFLRSVWSQGVDAGSDAGMRRIVEGANLPWSEALGTLGSDDWRPEAEANRQELLALGLWGVPSFRVRSTSVWGQDRLWVIEQELATKTI